MSFDSCDSLELTEGNEAIAGYLESDLPLCGDPGNLHLPWEAELGTVATFCMCVFCQCDLVFMVGLDVDMF